VCLVGGLRAFFGMEEGEAGVLWSVGDSSECDR
jgi:hypothetical protein